MKVNVDQTVEISDEDRKLISEKIGVKHATREDLKAFLWQHGRDWRQVLTPRVDDGFQVDPTNVNGVGDDEPEEDLLGILRDEREFQRGPGGDGAVPDDEDNEDLI